MTLHIPSVSQTVQKPDYYRAVDGYKRRLKLNITGKEAHVYVQGDLTIEDFDALMWFAESYDSNWIFANEGGVLSLNVMNITKCTRCIEETPQKLLEKSYIVPQRRGFTEEERTEKYKKAFTIEKRIESDEYPISPIVIPRNAVSLRAPNVAMSQ